MQRSVLNGDHYGLESPGPLLVKLPPLSAAGRQTKHYYFALLVLGRRQDVLGQSIAKATGRKYVRMAQPWVACAMRLKFARPPNLHWRFAGQGASEFD
jgi:ATP-dependent Lon protease